MKTIVVLLLIQVISVTLEYEFRCPVAGEWRLRPRKLFCGATQYVCLLYLPDKTYRETCDGLDLSSTGSKLVFQPNFNKAICSDDRYQPFPFSTDGSTSCVYKRSFCNAEGQIIFNKGNFENDTRCGCNVSKGYIFVTKPRNRCYCIPIQEDCSCYKPACYNKDSICPLDVGSIKNSSCSILSDNENIVPSTEDSLNTRTYVKDNNQRGRNYRYQCIFFTVGALVMITGIGWFVDQVTVTMQKKDEDIAVDFETSITLTCDFRVKRNWFVKSIDWYRNGKKIERCSSYTKIYKSDREVSLFIKTVGRNDLGNYKCVVNTILFKHKSGNLTLVIDMPMAIQYMNIKDKKIYKEALNSGVEVRRYVRIQVIGKHGVGKSSLIRNLLEDVVSTDEINVKTCLISTRDGTWTTSKVERERWEKMKRRILTMNQIDIKKTEQTLDSLEKTDDMTNTIIKQMDTILHEVKDRKDELTIADAVECGIWEFAGQKELYVTHQPFLTSNAIYLLVTNVNEDIKHIHDDQDFNWIDEYIDFWFDSIHLFCEDRTAHKLKPPVIVVCTHTDQCKALERRKLEYDIQFAKISGKDKKFCHKRDIVYISNKQVPGEINQLKSKISELAKEMEYFQVNLPKHWIKLENALDVITKTFGEKMLSWSNIMHLASQYSIHNKDDLLPFLKYQHSIGNIIFFENICDYIILQPTWLIKCFRCLVCEDNREKTSSNISTAEWTKLTQTGELSRTTIDCLFEKECDLKADHKQFVLAVMENFDIIVKPQFDDTTHRALSNSYYIPCMIREQITSLIDIKKTFGIDKCFKISPWLILEFTFLPFPHFNHILVSYIKEFTVCGADDEQKAIYRGKAVFFLDNSKVTRFIICFSKNAISLQIWDRGKGSDDLYKMVLEKLLGKIKDLEKKISHIAGYAIAASCSDGDYFNKDGRIRYENHKHVFFEKQYFCGEHKSVHDTNQIENTWFKHVDTVST